MPLRELEQCSIKPNISLGADDFRETVMSLMPIALFVTSLREIISKKNLLHMLTDDYHGTFDLGRSLHQPIQHSARDFGVEIRLSMELYLAPRKSTFASRSGVYELYDCTFRNELVSHTNETCQPRGPNSVIMAMMLKRNSLDSECPGITMVFTCSFHGLDGMPRHVRYPFPDLGIVPIPISGNRMTVNRKSSQFQTMSATGRYLGR